MTMYEIGSKGMIPLSPEGKNDLERGRILHLNGYNDPEFVITANLGIDSRFPDHGTRYQTIAIDTLSIGTHDAYALKWESEKADNRIQTYITDRIISGEVVADMEAKAEKKRAHEQDAKAKQAIETEAITAKGRALFEKHIPSTAKALIVAERHKDQSDLQTDYFNHSTTETIILTYSTHTKDLFAEMRKAAAKIPETAHLGPGLGHFEPHVMIGENIRSNGAAYWKGSVSHWHQELQGYSGETVVFQTRQEAEKYIQEKGEPDSIGFEGQTVPFYWEITEREIEHREKYSMGAGYYLKDGNTNASGWSVRKVKKYGDTWDNGLYYAMGKRCIF